MRQYELVYILNPDLEEKDQKSQTAKMEELITDLGGKVKKTEVWGKKRLAYPIKKFEEGVYLKLDLDFPEEKVPEWEKKMTLEEKIIRYLLIKVEG